MKFDQWKNGSYLKYTSKSRHNIWEKHCQGKDKEKHSDGPRQLQKGERRKMRHGGTGLKTKVKKICKNEKQ
jgi:hypothetical protein